MKSEEKIVDQVKSNQISRLCPPHWGESRQEIRQSLIQGTIDCVVAHKLPCVAEGLVMQ